MTPEEFNVAARSCLDRLDGSPASAVSLLTGVALEDLEEFGGMPRDDCSPDDEVRS